ncbi:caspase family protein [Sulfitobacter sp. M57]|nr:caspase family protein [Sulfitobacter sp. KE5]MDF3423524.1 caspase family protein [Sulfitobacter sp. KE43]MDF3434675.1 caspase family protein [Sulfitobacter sp. KE42]MDF3460230.1 caspase family protein [Sulfitobacter sp. S74]MDF3464212.1 caspase family protein [Sulfitobacter sp. Ks18]MDF3468321.1 caspase family protein [Sulfitobacter sp. M05]MDF3472007.1 caspase family protein [Sulfitobacter sp. M28]MDF3475756.1 caspase family protein [Sulfitobacter sp. M48]MDF3479575.1 caspase family pr
MALMIAVVLCAVAGIAAAQQDAPRIALIVGNGGYSSVAPLDNPVPDAELMAKTLEARGFQVTMLSDASQVTMNRAIAQFGRDLRKGGKEATGLFYYAGHAVQSFGSNFLLPTDASLGNAADLSLVGVPAQAVLRQMFSAKNKTNIVILDACRNNPFDAIPELNDNGLAEMKSPTGTFLSYSTAPGAVALDGTGDNSPFTRALADQIPVAGVPIEQVFKNVRVEVIAQTDGQQTPWDSSSLTGDFFFTAGVPLSEEEQAEEQLWASVKDSTDPVPVVLFMRGYPNSKYIEEARALLDRIVDAERTPAQEPADTSAEQQRLIGVAQSSGSAADYEAYLTAFPEGIYAEFAAFELKILAEKAKRDNAEPAAEETVVASRAAAAPMGPELTFAMPFTSGDPAIMEKSIEELVTLSPVFAPIEGLPEELWKEQSCSNCHQWTKEALCTQGTTYVNAGNDTAVSKKHPYGGGFKLNLRAWASGGCK